MRPALLLCFAAGCDCGTFSAHLARYDADYEGIEQCGAHDGTFAELDMLGTTLKVRLAPTLRGEDEFDGMSDIEAWFAIPVATLETARPEQNVFFAAQAQYINGDKADFGRATGQVYVLESLGESEHGQGDERATYVGYRLRWNLTFGDTEGYFNDWLVSTGEDDVEAVAE